MSSGAIPVTVLVTLVARKGSKKELWSLVTEELVPVTRDYEGCLDLELFRDLDVDGAIALLQRWTSRDQFESYLEWREQRGDLPRLRGLLSRPPGFAYFVTADPDQSRPGAGRGGS